MKKTGLFFGSFNPVHAGHLIIANYMCEFHALDEVWFVVTPCNPQKKQSALAGALHRLEMTRLAIAPYNKFHVCDIEFSLPQPTYTIHTLDALRGRYPQTQFYLLIGSDNWLTFPQWKEYQRICAEYSVLVYPRFGFDLHDAPECSNVQFTDAPRIEISSTFIRQALAAGKDIKCFVPIEVYKYIKNNELYDVIYPFTSNI